MSKGEWESMELYNVNYEVCAAIMLLIFYLSFLWNKSVNNERTKVYQLMVQITLVTVVLDVLSAWITNWSSIRPLPGIITYSVNMLYFIMAAFDAFFVVVYVLIAFKKKSVMEGLGFKLALIPIAVDILVILSTPITGWMFRFDANGIYQRGFFFPISMMIHYCYVLACSFLAVAYGTKSMKKQATACHIFTGMILVCGLLQIIFPNVLLVYMGVSAAVIVVYFSVQAPDSYQLLEEVEILKRNKEESEARERFFASLSHDIKAPLHAILGINGLISMETEDENIRNYATQIRTSGQTLQVLVNDILDFSRLGTGNMPIVSMEYEFKTMLDDIANLMYYQIGEKNLQFVMNISPDIPSKLIGDEIRLKQVLSNLLVNAVKYTKEGSVCLEIKVEPSVNKEVKLTCVVADTGKGIKEEHMKDLFTSYRRIEEDKNGKVEGSGLGLVIVSRLLELMGSEIQVNSVYGQGSQFSFEIKQKVADYYPIGAYTSDYERQRPRKVELTGKEILMVDDNDVNLVILNGILKRTGAKVDMAHSGVECIEKVKKNHYDIILLDHLMPKMSGGEALLKIREYETEAGRPHMKAIMVSANSAQEIRDVKEKYNFDGFLEKPTNPERLIAMIQKMLSQG